jgi:hypothetical protein
VPYRGTLRPGVLSDLVNGRSVCVDLVPRTWPRPTIDKQQPGQQRRWTARRTATSPTVHTCSSRRLGLTQTMSCMGEPGF